MDLNEISDWARLTFGRASPIRAAIRANEEMAELLKEVYMDCDPDKIMEEAAEDSRSSASIGPSTAPLGW